MVDRGTLTSGAGENRLGGYRKTQALIEEFGMGTASTSSFPESLSRVQAQRACAACHPSEDGLKLGALTWQIPPPDISCVTLQLVPFLSPVPSPWPSCVFPSPSPC